MNAEHELLASAYLDGELTDEERHIAETDPAVMAEVEQLRALRAELAAPPPPSDAAREAAVAAAMAEFGQLYGTAATEASAANERSVPFRPRPATGRWLSIAAAVLVVGLLGVVVATGLRGGDDDDSAASELAEEPLEAAAEEPADDGGRMTEQAPTVAADAADDAGAGLADEPASEPADEEMAADEPASDEPADDLGDDDMAAEALPDDDMDTDTSEGSDPADIVDRGVPITTEEELAAVGQLLLERAAMGELTTPEESCPYPNMLARADYLDPLTDELWPVVIDVDEDANLVLAIDVDTCEVRLDAALTQMP